MFYARQIPYEHTESPMFLFPEECFTEDYIITGNKEFKEFTNVHYDAFMEYLEDLETDMQDLSSEELTDENIINLVKQYYCHIDDEKAKAIGHTIREEILKPYRKYTKHDEYNYICKLYSILEDKEYTYKTIHGCCQGDWNYLIYPKDYTSKDINIIETEYFNTGLEYMIHDSDNIPENPEDINGYCVYVHSWKEEDIREELSSAIGCKQEELIIYNVSNYHTRTFYDYKQI